MGLDKHLLLTRVKGTMASRANGRTLCRKKRHSRQRLCGFENLLGPRAYKIILCHHSPANGPGWIDQELSRTRNVCVFSAGAGWQRGVIVGVNQIIAANCLESWIREKSKSVSSFLDHHFASFLGRINADRNYTNSRIRKRRQIVFETPQLGVT